MTTPDTADETDSPPQTRPFDPLAALRIDELDAGSRQLKASIVGAITERTQDYERALAVVLWLHARRTDPAAKLAEFRQLTFLQLNDRMGQLTPDVDDDELGPTAPGRE